MNKLNSDISKEERDLELLILDDYLKECKQSKENLEIKIKGYFGNYIYNIYFNQNTYFLYISDIVIKIP